MKRQAESRVHLRARLQHQKRTVSSDHDDDDDDALCNSGIDKLTQWWEAVWSTDSKCSLGFDTLFDEQDSKLEKFNYIEPDRIKAPKVLLNTSKERPPSPKKIWSSRSSEATDLDFDYGAAIGLQPEEWPSISDSDSTVEAMAVSLETCLQTAKKVPEKAMHHHHSRSNIRELKASSALSSCSDPDYTTGTQNTSSMHESVERNWEYFENLRRCYDPDNIIVSPSLHERTRSEESTPDLKAKLKSQQSFYLTEGILGEKKLLRRVSSPAFATPESLGYFKHKILDMKRRDSRALPKSGKSLRRSQSSYDFKGLLNVGKLRVVNENEDELSLPFEPMEKDPQVLRKMKGIITKGFLVERVINDIKKEIVFKEEAKDELHDLPDIRKSARLTSPEPTDLPREFRQMNYRDLNKFGLASPTSPMKNGINSISPILKMATEGGKRKGTFKAPTQKPGRPFARLSRPSQGYTPLVHKSLFQFDLEARLEEDLANIQVSDSEEEVEGNLPKPSSMRRFDSSACMILPNSYCSKAD